MLTADGGVSTRTKKEDTLSEIPVVIFWNAETKVSLPGVGGKGNFLSGGLRGGASSNRTGVGGKKEEEKREGNRKTCVV